MKRSSLLCLAVAAAAATVLFWNLGVRYLWQDEAACAELSKRMLEHGKPLAFDGKNLITMDEFNAKEGDGIQSRTGSAQAAVDYYRAKGDFKDDTTWIGQPWGQFVFTAASFVLFGEGTFQARLPFALAAVATAVLLAAFVRERFGTGVALLSVALLLTNTYWLLHVRQCRYYGSSSLFLLLTLVAYFRWQEGRRLGPLLFVLAGWGYFHNDFGSFWPVIGVCFFDAVSAARRDRRRVLASIATFAALGLAVLPFLFYYELFGRLKEQPATLAGRLTVNLYNLNAFQLPLLVLVVLGVLAWRRRSAWADGQARLLALIVAVVVAQFAWLTAVSPFPFYRYFEALTPLSCLVVAFTVVQLGAAAAARFGRDAGRWSTAAAALLVVFTPLPANALGWADPVPRDFRQILAPTGTWLRHEHRVLLTDLKADTPDPNRAIVEFLREAADPGDEIIVNYEDVPLMFYLDNPVRGGIACFRVEDESVDPAFLVLRRSVGFTHAAPYNREVKRHDWVELEVDAPEMTWGNNPDPWCHYTRQARNDKWGSIDVYVNRAVRPGLARKAAAANAE